MAYFLQVRGSNALPLMDLGLSKTGDANATVISGRGVGSWVRNLNHVKLKLALTLADIEHSHKSRCQEDRTVIFDDRSILSGFSST
jgi:hypothetical protein